MINPFPFRALSPHHATAMDLDYLMKVLDAAEAYGFNALQICGDTHGAGNLDGVTVFERFPKANDVQEMDGVRRRREILRTVCRAAHDRGMEVYYWHHELWFPQRLPEVYPDWFAAAPKNRFTRDLYTDRVPRIEPGAPIWDFMDAKFDEAFAQIPELDGTVMTIQESRVPVYCLFEDFEQQVEALVDQYRRLEAAHRRAGRKWIIRTFAWREHEYRVVTEAIRRWRPGVPVESKGVPMDWDLYYPYDPLLGEFEGMTKHVEIGADGPGRDDHARRARRGRAGVHRGVAERPGRHGRRRGVCAVDDGAVRRGPPDGPADGLRDDGALLAGDAARLPPGQDLHR